MVVDIWWKLYEYWEIKRSKEGKRIFEVQDYLIVMEIVFCMNIEKLLRGTVQDLVLINNK